LFLQFAEQLVQSIEHQATPTDLLLNQALPSLSTKIGDMVTMMHQMNCIQSAHLGRQDEQLNKISQTVSEISEAIGDPQKFAVSLYIRANSRS
jgi:hypothetical protein